MGQLQVLFEVPRYIEHGLATGAFQRVGGVIVDSGSKQVVAWLRDGSLVEVGFQAASSAANPLNTILQAAQTTSSLIDGHMTRQAIGALSSQMAKMTTLVVGGQLINIAISSVTFFVIMRRLHNLSNSIEELGEAILAEFDRDRETRFQRALQTAQDAFDSQQETTRKSKARKAEDDLLEARMHFFTDLKNVLETDPKGKQLLLAHHFLIQAMYAEISRIRCFLVDGEGELAKVRFAEILPEYESYVKKLIALCIDDKFGTSMFHENVPPEYLARFFTIQQWLRGIKVGNDPITMFEIIKDFRTGFWDDSVLPKKGFALPSFKNREQPSRFTTDDLADIEERLTQSELLIENYDRLTGFDLEIRSMRLSFKDWTNLVSQEDLEKNGGALIVDDEMADKYERLSIG